MKKLNIKVRNAQGQVQTFEVEVEEVGAFAAPMATAPVVAPAAAPVAAPAPAATPAPAAPAPAAAPAAAAGAVSVKAPMPGNIMKVNVNPGDVVKAGDVLCVLEAMKMENDIKAAQDGTVASVHVQKGATVNTGDLLVSLN